MKLLLELLLIDTNNDDDGDLAPCCHILLEWMGEHSSTSDLKHKVMILGTTENDCFFLQLHTATAIMGSR